MLGLPLWLLRLWMDMDLCHSMDIHRLTLGSCEKPGKETLGAQVLSLYSSGIKSKTSKAKVLGEMVLGCSIQWLCLPGHRPRDLVIPLG